MLFKPGMKALYAVWVASVLVLLTGDRSTAYLALGIGGFVALLVALGKWALPAGNDEPADALKQEGTRGSLAARGVVLAIAVAWTVLLGLSFNIRVPYVTAFFFAALRMHTGLPRGGWGPALTLTLAVIPGLMLLALGARPRQLGLVWKSGGRLRLSLWIAIPFGLALWRVLTGHLSPWRLVLVLLENVMLNGFPEEFLFRGALLTYFRAFLATDWAFFLQAVLFSLVHYGITIPEEHGKVFLILANVLAENIPVAMIFGLMALRSRSLAMGVTVHFAFDSIRNILR
jgi:membrane protease YdiL (CAAX protease family)